MEGTSSIDRGAEAEISQIDFMGRRAISKTRAPKGYRVAELDNNIRATRTRTEARLMREARKVGIRTPIIYDIDTKEFRIVMEEVQGKKVKDVLDQEPDSINDVCIEIGRTIAHLHNHHISHGDLTTSNMIFTSDGRICLIDMSMGSTMAELEDIGVDIRLLERAFISAHPELTDGFSKLMDSYINNVNEPDKILNKLQEIKDRGRYT